MSKPFNFQKQVYSGSAGSVSIPLKSGRDSARVFHFIGFNVAESTTGDVAGPFFKIKSDNVEQEYGPEFLSLSQGFSLYLEKNDELSIRVNHNQFTLTVFASGIEL